MLANTTSAFCIGPFRVAPHVRNGKPSGRWTVNVPKCVLGQRKRYFWPDRKTAVEYARGLENQYKRGKWDGVRGQITSTTKSHTPSLRLKSAIEKWGEFQEVRVATDKKKEVSLYTDRGRLKAVLAFFGDVELSAITEEKLARFQAHRRNIMKRAPATIKSDVVALGKVLRWALGLGYLSKVPPFEHIREPKRVIHIPTLEEIARIVNEVPERLKPLVQFLAETGCRTGEAFNLTWDCLDLITGAVDIRPHDQWTPKTRSSERRIYINNKALLEKIRQTPKVGPYVFAGANPQRPINNIKKAFATAVKTANIIRDGKPIAIKPHRLRKAFATLAARNGMRPRDLQEWLGHAPGSRVTDQYYIVPLDEAKRQVNVFLPL